MAEGGEFRRHHAVASDARPQEALARARAQLFRILHQEPLRYVFPDFAMQKPCVRRRVPRVRGRNDLQ
jgi:hypothetical protein